MALEWSGWEENRHKETSEEALVTEGFDSYKVTYKDMEKQKDAA